MKSTGKERRKKGKGIRGKERGGIKLKKEGRKVKME